MPNEDARKFGKMLASKTRSRKKFRPSKISEEKEWAGLAVAKFFPTELSDEEEKRDNETTPQLFDLPADSPRAPRTERRKQENEASGRSEVS